MDVSLEELLSFIQVLFLFFVHFYSYQHRPGVMYNINCWDFAGQKEFYSTHQCFLTRRSLYLVSVCMYMRELRVLRFCFLKNLVTLIFGTLIFH